MTYKKQIRISEEVFNEIQKRARPLTDTADSVLRRVLGLTPKRERESAKQTDVDQETDEDGNDKSA